MPLNSPTTDLVHLIRELTVALDLLAARFAREHDLHASDLRALIALLDAERAGTPASPGRLATQLDLSTASITALVDRLARRGFVTRSADGDDRRRVRLEVTPAARAMGTEFFGPLITRVVEALDDEFTDGERELLRRMLISVTTAAGPPLT